MLLRELQFANLQEFRLRSIGSIPNPLTHPQLCSVKSLALDGQFHLKDTVRIFSFVLEVLQFTLFLE